MERQNRLSSVGRAVSTVIVLLDHLSPLVSQLTLPLTLFFVAGLPIIPAGVQAHPQGSGRRIRHRPAALGTPLPRQNLSRLLSPSRAQGCHPKY